MNTDTDTNVCVVIHEPEIVTITMTINQLRLMETLMDVVRQDELDDVLFDDVERVECAELAEAVYQEIGVAFKKNVAEFYAKWINIPEASS